ncbi:MULTISPECIES: DUF928 domain-containing protein [unclassified Microcoleus]|uniref:DUF928 domain-containing protein n=1 Tax=unclassified Microcoleus TaxID=2642155 RepID=UPI002FD6D3BF
MYKMQLQLVLALIWAIESGLPIVNWTYSPIQQQISKTPQTPPDPNTTPGGGLDPSNSSCKKTKQPLTALIPQKNLGLTTSARPTFWFYIPYVREDIQRGGFVLVNQDEKTVIYDTIFQLPQTPGIVSISIPLSSESALEESKTYRWFLKIYCNKRTNRADLVVDGSVKRVEMTAETERLINAASPDIWYDSLTRLGDLLLTSPQDEKLKNDWNKLLESIGRKELSKEPLVGPVVELGG